MNAGDAARVVALSSQVRDIQQALALIDGGAIITAMTLTPPLPPPPAPAAATPERVPSGPEEREEPEPEATEPDEVPPEPEQAAIGAMTISTEGLTYPPQMMQVIRAQELEMWKTAYDELSKLGATDVPAPPGAQAAPQAAPAAAQQMPPPAAAPRRAPVPPRRR